MWQFEERWFLQNPPKKRSTSQIPILRDSDDHSLLVSVPINFLEVEDKEEESYAELASKVWLQISGSGFSVC